MRPDETAHYRVLIADDEPLARERVRMMLESRPEYEIVAESGDGTATVEAIAEHEPDLVFLDIRMPELDGFEVLAAVEQSARPPAIVFTTAFDAYALRAFETGAIDYLLKPFNAERFAQTLVRIESRLVRSGAATTLEPALIALLETLRTERTYQARFLVRGSKRLYFVHTHDIEWADTQENYVRLHVGGKAHMLRDTMERFITKLPPDQFVRVHRSVVVRIDQIDYLEPHVHGEYIITLRNGRRVTSSKVYGQQLRALLR
jgi:two-component system LytT family response regulator